LLGDDTFTETSAFLDITSDGMHTFQFRIAGSGTSRAGISVDDFFVVAVEVSEPTTLALFSAGLLALGRAHRRKRRV
jgi:hypothetical protein